MRKTDAYALFFDLISEVGQRLTDRFSAHQHRIFIAGSVAIRSKCHTQDHNCD